jgi:peptidoglycan hydrolase-like protein with peptidoglycan-binding domain
LEYAKNKYDTRLAAAYQEYALGLLPDINVRAAQIYLTYLGYQPGSIDGAPGKLTYSALNNFQRQNGLALTNEINERLLSILKEKTSA